MLLTDAMVRIAQDFFCSLRLPFLMRQSRINFVVLIGEWVLQAS